nr:hypothetical protein [Tanacetum cinerariifolium]
MTLELANRPIAYPVGIAEDVFMQVGKFTFVDFIVVNYDVDPCVPLILGRPFLTHALVDLHREELTLRVGDEKSIFNVESTSKYPQKHENDPTLFSDLVVAFLSPSLTPLGDSDFLLEETNAFLTLDDSIPPKIDNGIYDSERYILFLEKLLIDDPTKNLLPKELKNNETKMTKSSIEEPSKFELKNLPPPTSNNPIFDIQNEESDESKTETIMEEVQIHSSQSTAQILPPYRMLNFDLTMPNPIITFSQFRYGIFGSHGVFDILGPR